MTDSGGPLLACNLDDDGMTDESAANDFETERLAAAALVSEEYNNGFDNIIDINNDNTSWQSRPPNNISGVKSTGLMDDSMLNSLLNKLHLSGIQKRNLPQDFTPSCITNVLLAVKPVLSSENSCLQVTSPVVLLGDLHGEFHILAKLTDILGKPPARSYLFLGDYVDRGPHSLETLLYLLLFKTLYPRHVFILRGNHEDRRVYRFFNFEDDLVRIFGLAQGQNLSSLFHTVLCYMPVCAIVNAEIFCCHGGLSPHFNHPKFGNSQQEFIDKINELQKPVIFRKSDFVSDLLWSDPLDLEGSRLPNLQSVACNIDEWLDHRIRVIETSRLARLSIKRKLSAVDASGKQQQHNDPATTPIDWMPNPRGCSYVFSKTAFAEFARRYRINWLVRGHMYVSKGYKECFNGRCITLFSAADYAQKFHNIGAIIAIDGPSNGRHFPGRIMRFAKHSLLNYSGQLPTDTALWPHEISNRAKSPL